MIAARLDQALKAAGLPITSVTIGLTEDRSTWKVHPAALQADAQPIIDAFVLPSPEQVADDAAQRETQRKELKAVALGLWECIPAPLMTKAQLADRIKAIYKSL